jgi:purine catabolism regulator
MISVQDILEIPDLYLRLLAGAGATNDSVRWVHVDDVQQSTQSLKGGELLLTTGRGFTGSEAQQVERLEELVGRNIVGLGFGTGFGFDEVPAALVRSAEDCGLPLLEIPPHISFSLLTEAVAAKIVNDRYSLLQRSLAVYEKLTRIVLEEEGLGAILATLSGLTGCFAVLFDFHGAVLGQASSRRHFGAKTIGELWRAITERRTGRVAFAIDLGGTSLEARAYPVVAAHRTVAFIVAVKDSGSFGEYDRVVLHNVVTATALELVKQKAVAETEKRLVGDFLDGLTTSTLPADEIARRLKVFGLDPQAAHLVMILEFDGREPVAAHAVPERLHWAVDEFMVEHRLACISTSRDDHVVVLLEPGDLGEGDVRALAGELLAAVRGLLPEIAVLVGLGRSHPSLDLSRRRSASPMRAFAGPVAR